ncbi:MAG: molybdenum cofactor guanylyltransferase [Bacteroidota bacterium]
MRGFFLWKRKKGKGQRAKVEARRLFAIGGGHLHFTYAICHNNLHLYCILKADTDIRLTGIILAGGRGIRLGRDKGMAMLKNRHMIEYVIDNLAAVCDEILISSNTEQCKKFGYKIIPDIYKAKGPISGIHASLKASSNEHNFIVSVDTPFVNPDFIKYMAGQRDGKWIAAPWHEKDYYEPLSAYYNKKAVDVMEDFIQKEDYRLVNIFQALPFSAVPVNKKLSFYHPMLFHNINTEEDLQKAELFMNENGMT